MLFDLDDTILRFNAGQPNFWQRALESSLPERDDHQALLASIDSASNEFWGVPRRAFWGRQNMQEARRLIARAVLSEHGVGAEMCQRIADEMTELKESQVRPFDGALEALRLLRARGHRLGLLTNGSAAFQRKKLSRFALEPLFERVLIEGEFGYGKPDDRVFRMALEHFGVAPDQVWMIGDNLEADIAPAQRNGIEGVWHDAHGSGLPERPPVVPDRVIARIAELLPESV